MENIYIKYLKYAIKNKQFGGKIDNIEDYVNNYMNFTENKLGYINLINYNDLIDNLPDDEYIIKYDEKINEAKEILKLINNDFESEYGDKMCKDTKIGSNLESKRILSYGDEQKQNILKSQCYVIINTISNMYKNNISIEDIIFYTGFRRYVVESIKIGEIITKRDNSKSRNFGLLRITYDDQDIHTLETPLIETVGNRKTKAVEFIEEIFKIPNIENDIIFEYYGTSYKKFGKIEDNICGVEIYDENKINLAVLNNIFGNYSYSESKYYKTEHKNYIKNIANLYDKLHNIAPENREKQLELIAKIHWYLCIKVPHIRGGGSIAEWICAGLMLGCDMKFSHYNQEYELWLEAITSPINRFVNKYPEYVILE